MVQSMDHSVVGGTQIFVEAIKEFPILIIQSKTSANTYEYSKSNRASMGQIRIRHVA